MFSSMSHRSRGIKLGDAGNVTFIGSCNMGEPALVARGDKLLNFFLKYDFQGTKSLWLLRNRRSCPVSTSMPNENEIFMLRHYIASSSTTTVISMMTQTKLSAREHLFMAQPRPIKIARAKKDHVMMGKRTPSELTARLNKKEEIAEAARIPMLAI